MVQESTVDLVNRFFEMFTRSGPRRLEVDKIGFINDGYWKGVEDSIEQAQINLIETLVSFFVHRDGSVLDVACGRGASSKYLTKYFSADSITGIESLDRHIDICRLTAPNCHFSVMDATSLDLGDSTFDNVLCMEAAYHFYTRHRFLEEAHRVLRYGGRLAISDFFLQKHEHQDFLDQLPPDWPREGWPKENCLTNMDTYKESLLRIGFRYVRIEDSTQFKAAAYRRFRISKAEKTASEDRDFAKLQALTNQRDLGTYCMVYAIK